MNIWYDARVNVPNHSHFVWVALNDGITVTSARYIADRNLWTSIRDIHDAGTIKYWREKEQEPVHPDLEVE